MIRLDQSDATTLAICTTCGWRAVRRDKLQAWDAGHSHQRLAHPDEVGQAYRAAQRMRQRNTPVI